MKDVFMEVFRSAPAAMLLLVVVQCTAVLAIALIVARWFRRNPAVRYAVLWTGLLCALACPFIGAALQSADVTCFSIPVAIAGETERPNEPMVKAAINESPAAEPAYAVLTAIQELQPLDTTPPPNAAVDDSQIPAPVVSQPSGNAPSRGKELKGVASLSFLGAILVWTAGCAWRALGLVRSWFKLRRVVRRASPIADARVRRIAEACRGELGCRRRVALLTSVDVNCPVAAGLRRPVILLPRGICDELADVELRAVLLHELAHVARHDHAALLIEGVFAAVYWPHPLAAWLRRGLARAREEICDNYVVRRTDRRAYSELLLRLARSRPPRPLVAVGVGLFSTRWRLESRVAALLDERRRTMVQTNRLITFAIAAAMLAIVLGIGVTKVVAERETPQDDVPATKSSLALNRANASEDDVAAYVNDEPITRGELAAEILERHGQKALETLANRKLLEQECEERGIKITDADIEAEVDLTAKKYGLNRDAWYAALKQDRGISPERYHQDVVWPTLAIVRLAGTDDPKATQDFFFEFKSRANVAVVADEGGGNQTDARLASVVSNDSPSAVQRVRSGQRIALVNLPKIFKEWNQFQEDSEALSKHMQSEENTFKERLDEIEGLERARNEFKPNAAAFKALDEVIAEKKAAFTASRNKLQKSFMERETRMYLDSFQVIQQVIADYADEHAIDIVLRDTTDRAARQVLEKGDLERIDPHDRSEIMRRINRDVVYIRDTRMDITDAIIERLQARAEMQKPRR